MRALVLSTSLTLTLLLAGCGAAKQAAGTATGSNTSQVVARVNGNELTISQLNLALSDNNVTSLDTASTRQVLDDLINEELIVEQALTAKLDRDADVLLRIEQAKRLILAEAYEDRNVYPQAAISETEIHKYYDENPAFFKERRVYRLTAFSTEKATLPDAVSSQLGTVHTADAVRELLNRNGIDFKVEELSEGADAMAIDLVPRLALAKVGDVVPTTHGSGKLAALLLVEDIKSSPLPYEQASSTIENFLTSERNTAALSAYLARLRKGARIEYVGSVGAAATTTDAEHAAAGLKNLN